MSDEPPLDSNGVAAREVVPRPLLESHHRLEAALGSLRSATPDNMTAVLRSLAFELRSHLDVAARFLYPMVERLRPDIGDDIVWYPDLHERNALRLVERLRVDLGAISPRLIDEIAIDVRRSILELERRVLPELTRQLDDADVERLLRTVEG